ncbi:MAG: hypothetical protein NTY19_05910 [Planctomycetota bacterium]|nr:hypothetical protein [Planctomycetota bacterium]
MNARRRTPKQRTPVAPPQVDPIAPEAPGIATLRPGDEVTTGLPAETLSAAAGPAELRGAASTELESSGVAQKTDEQLPAEETVPPEHEQGTPHAPPNPSATTEPAEPPEPAEPAGPTDSEQTPNASSSAGPPPLGLAELETQIRARLEAVTERAQKIGDSTNHLLEWGQSLDDVRVAARDFVQRENPELERLLERARQRANSQLAKIREISAAMAHDLEVRESILAAREATDKKYQAALTAANEWSAETAALREQLDRQIAHLHDWLQAEEERWLLPQAAQGGDET